MQEIESDWWFIDLPEQWFSEQDDDSILIFDEDELGCICLSTLEAEPGAMAGADAVKGLINSVGHSMAAGKPCTIGEDWRGWEFETVEEGDYIREWYLYGPNHLLLITYSCAEDDRDMDRSAVEEILDTLRVKA
ncbi:MAG: hypothetical protein R3221_02110 [Spongiibacter sp.]|uniref:DUF3805 domain-containing protein n=1 Tax=Spongiibacter thalassae TaxID=2721624 RepID=A0ABX1GBJ1_9GAMM|nr:hypothetical protein [Spongiibacter thalassae]MDX1504481.1 hypothetical protein [Spongiibacter sp.]NKI16291.1 hypothetical protein [Spongiibacter thalassae]